MQLCTNSIRVGVGPAAKKAIAEYAKDKKEFAKFKQ